MKLVFKDVEGESEEEGRGGEPAGIPRLSQIKLSALPGSWVTSRRWRPPCRAVTVTAAGSAGCQATGLLAGGGVLHTHPPTPIQPYHGSLICKAAAANLVAPPYLSLFPR